MQVYRIQTDTGLTAMTQTEVDLLQASQDILRDVVTRYGEWIYAGAGTSWEYRNFWLPQLRDAKKFTVQIEKDQPQ